MEEDRFGVFVPLSEFNSSDESVQSDSARQASVVVPVFYFVIGIIGNVLTVIALFLCKVILSYTYVLFDTIVTVQSCKI